MERIVFLDRDSLIATLRSPDFAHQWVDYPATAAYDVLTRLAGASVAVVNKVCLTADILARLPELKHIAISATGTNNVDLAAAKKQGIAVTNIRGYAESTVPEHVLALMLALSRNLLAYRQAVQAGRWQKSAMFCFFDYPVRDLKGSTLVLVGSGSLGQGVARLAEAFGMRVLRAERRGATRIRPGYVAFAEGLQAADVLSLHCPLNEETRGLIGREELQAMKRSALLINTARGGIVDEGALKEALRSGWIAGAGFDVLSSEPPPDDHPLLDPELLALPNFLLTPHVAWASREAMQKLADQLIDNIEAFAAGRAQNRVV